MSRTAETAYGRLAEFHDLFVDEAWARLRPHVREAFAGAGAESVIAELGAGTGVGTRAIARETPARIVALEPDLVMRAILTARVADDPDLATRVTVVAGSVPADLDLLPSGVDGFVCAHMLGHLDRDARRGLFAWLGAHLSPDGVGLVTTQSEPDAAPGGGGSAEELVEIRKLGEYEYRAHYGSPSGTGEHSSRYEVWQDGTKIRDERFAGTWRILAAEDIAADLPPTLAIEPIDRSTALVGPAGPALVGPGSTGRLVEACGDSHTVRS